jgi:hypothetical protein
MKFISGCLAALLLVTGCSAVYTRQPLGSTPADIAAESAAWEGTWMCNDGAVTVHVVDASNGLLTIAWDETHSEGIRHKSADLILRSHSGMTYVSTLSDDKTLAGLYSWARIKRDDRSAVVWLPDIPAFRKLVDDGTLPGDSNGDNVILGELDTNHVALICTDDPRLLRWNEPLMFWKVSE